MPRDADILFQFQIGSIKGRFFSHNATSYTPFQFQIGSIKGVPLKCSGVGHIRFNSRLVRLKEKNRWCAFGHDTCFNSRLVRLKECGTFGGKPGVKVFQFQIGSIKGPMAVLQAIHQLPRFNSRLVRLKELVVYLNRPGLLSFNSRLVRLKVLRLPLFLLRCMFQFQIGSIKGSHQGWSSK